VRSPWLDAGCASSHKANGDGSRSRCFDRTAPRHCPAHRSFCRRPDRRPVPPPCREGRAAPGHSGSAAAARLGRFRPHAPRSLSGRCVRTSLPEVRCAQSGAARRAQPTSPPYPCRSGRRSPGRVNAPHLAGRRSSTLLDSDPQCLVTRKCCHILPLAESREFGVARPDASRMRCPAETLGEGKGERTAGKGRETATADES
jgi:hypothetical protein